MNRPIEFRAWDKEKKIMFCIFDSTGQAEWYLPNVKGDRYVYMQWTGLFDKNGVKIFELDIVSDGAGEGVVYWIKEFVCFAVQELPTRDKTFNFGRGEAMHDNKLNGTEIIGNIFQNPELLGPKNDQGAYL